MLALVLAAHLTTAAAPSYAEQVAGIEQTRLRLAARYGRAKSAAERSAVLEAARAAVLQAIETKLFPAWFGTPWAFYGNTQTPNEGSIACGYFVSTVLRDAGVRVNRVKLAQQASAYIVRTFASPASRFVASGLSPAELVEQVRVRYGDGLYAVGLDFHVAFLIVDGQAAQLCHSSVFEPRAVVCEPAEKAEALVSNLYVVGRLFDDAMVKRWLAASRFEVATPPED